jgi:hypothetical protein
MKAIEYKGYTIKIETEDQPLNPRGDDFYTTLGTLVAMHRRYDLGDSQHLSDGSKLKSEDFNGWDAMIAHVDKVEGGIIWLPVYMYDHSGITINTTGFSAFDSARWDWGQLGFIYISKKKVREIYGWKVINKQRIAKLEEYLRSDLEVYDQYLRGDVYRYEIISPDGEDEDSCGGYYGSDHEKSGLMEQAKNAIDCSIKHKLKTEGVQTELALKTA